MAGDFYRRAAKVVANPWMIAVGADFASPKTTGPKPPGTDLVNRYLAKVQHASHVSERVQTQLMRVQNLLAPPQSLMLPGTVIRVLRTAPRSPIVSGAPGPRPTVGETLIDRV
jgi:hypothetical protein